MLKTAVAQIESRVGDLSANVDKHLAYVEEARALGADCLLFPEMSLTGHSAGRHTLDVAIPRNDPSLRRIAEASGPMWTTVGFVEEGPAAQFYNAAVVLHEGRMVFIHRKLILATYGRLDDGKHFAPGRYLDTFALRNRWRAGLLICNDLWNPALVYLAALHGSTILFVPVSSAVEAVARDFDNPSGWKMANQFYARVYGMPVVFANRVGEEDGLTFWGGSSIFDSFGRELASAGGEETLIAADLDYGDVRQARYQLPTVRDSNLSLIAREIVRLQGILGVPEDIRED